MLTTLPFYRSISERSSTVPTTVALAAPLAIRVANAGAPNANSIPTPTANITIPATVLTPSTSWRIGSTLLTGSVDPTGAYNGPIPEKTISVTKALATDEPSVNVTE